MYFLPTYKISKNYNFRASFPLKAVRKDNLPAKKKCNIKDGAVQVDKLEEEHFQGKAVFPFRFCSRVLCRKTQYTWYKQKWNKIMPKFAHRSINTNKTSDRFNSWSPIKVVIIVFLLKVFSLQVTKPLSQLEIMLVLCGNTSYKPLSTE